MKLSLNWLKDHLETNATLDEIVEKLTAIGLEVEDVIDRAKTYDAFRLVEIISTEPHPNADRLKVCQVKTGNGMIQVVCGASNARAGLKAFHAPEGSVIPSSGMVMKKSKIRDVESNGMMVSLSEMALAEDSEGIIEADPALPLGTGIADAFRLNDPVIEINLTPNRPDCAGIRGIARDLAAAGLGSLKPLSSPDIPVAGLSSIKVTISEDAADACPLFIARRIRNVTNGQSAEIIASKLKAVGQKPISTLVDITNYFSIGLARPLHVFDADKVQGDLHIRLSRKGESFEALNGKTYDLDDGMTVVCDDSGIIGLGGVMGGNTTAVDENTRNVILEIALFDPYRTAKTGRALQINSDARYRFERGVDPDFASFADALATQMILDSCGGEADDSIQAGRIPEKPAAISWRRMAAEKLLGFPIDIARQRDILLDLGFEISGDGDIMTVTAPGWRPDIGGENDLVEEIARIYGFDRIPALPVIRESAISQPAETATGARIRKTRHGLAAAGLQECVTWSFLSHMLAQDFGGGAVALRLQNPISADLDQMRPSILPNLITAAHRNANRGLPNAALFEIGPVFAGTEPGDQQIMASGIRTGTGHARHWNETARSVDVFDVKADAQRVLELCGIASGATQITRDVPEWYHPGRAGSLRQGQTVLACFGEIHPRILAKMGIDFPVVAFDVMLEKLPEAKRKTTTALPPLTISELQPVARDFAFTLKDETDGDTLLRAIRMADRDLIANAAIFDVYKGKGVEDGMKSVAVAVTLQPKSQTLTDADIETISKKIIDAAAAKANATLRR